MKIAPFKKLFNFYHSSSFCGIQRVGFCHTCQLSNADLKGCNFEGNICFFWQCFVIKKSFAGTISEYRQILEWQKRRCNKGGGGGEMKSFFVHCPLCSEHREHCDIDNPTSMSGSMKPLQNKSTLPTHYSPVGCISESSR